VDVWADGRVLLDGRRATPRRTDGSCLWCSASLAGRKRNAKFCSTSCSMKHWHWSHPGQQRWYMLKCIYGVDQADFNEMFAAQGGMCAICGTDQPSGDGRIAQWNIDHDHSTGKVRGILCSQCNIGIGQLRDDPDLLRRAIAYLERGGTP
jgi:hypothetical protein